MDGKKPKPSFSIGGYRGTGQYRLRPTWFGVVLEELVERSDGSQGWEKCSFPVEIKKAHA